MLTICPYTVINVVSYVEFREPSVGMREYRDGYNTFQYNGIQYNTMQYCARQNTTGQIYTERYTNTQNS